MSLGGAGCFTVHRSLYDKIALNNINYFYIFKAKIY